METHSKILLTGTNSKICQEFKKLLSSGCELIEISRQICDFSDLDQIDKIADKIKEADKIVLCHAVIGTERFLGRTQDDILESLKVNLLSYVKIIELALDNPKVKIVAIGSESGVKGSFDIPYALSKFALHKYVEERKTSFPDQQLVCIAPSTISDSVMTMNRKDQQNVINSINQSPKRRGIYSREVANLIYFVLFGNWDYINNTVIHMNGGKYARM